MLKNLVRSVNTLGSVAILLRLTVDLKSMDRFYMLTRKQRKFLNTAADIVWADQETSIVRIVLQRNGTVNNWFENHPTLGASQI